MCVLGEEEYKKDVDKKVPILANHELFLRKVETKVIKSFGDKRKYINNSESIVWKIQRQPCILNCVYFKRCVDKANSLRNEGFCN